VEILDPATGTGTFIVELLEHFRGQPDKLRHKYKEELHANEVAILPYYVANLNIEATYAAITGQYAEFPNLCFVDTLDNVAALGNYAATADLLGAVSDENVERVRARTARKISVIIGNPPYNACRRTSTTATPTARTSASTSGSRRPTSRKAPRRTRSASMICTHGSSVGPPTACLKTV
jgi:predicted helicase